MNTNNESKPMTSEEVEAQLRTCRIHAPDDFCNQVMQTLQQPAPQKKRTIVWWPSNGGWLIPALAGAAAMLLVWLGTGLLDSPPAQPVPPQVAEQRVWVTFELHAPDAHSVELAGSFTDWTIDAIELTGPDATGNWSVDVPLSEGRHEYQFLVDGKEWITDPSAMTYREDGFGSRNAVMEL